MDNSEEIINLEIIKNVLIQYSEDEWDNNFGDHSITLF
jgi:hypothetical protein